jgi:hypothetical protein
LAWHLLITRAGCMGLLIAAGKDGRAGVVGEALDSSAGVI